MSFEDQGSFLEAGESVQVASVARGDSFGYLVGIATRFVGSRVEVLHCLRR